MHLAWQFLLHAECEQAGVDYRYHDGRGRLVRTPDGAPKTWSLSSCLSWRYPTATDGVRANVEFFVGLRNQIEHRYQDQLIAATAGYAHALVINYESEVVRVFGSDYSLGGRLRFPLFVQSLSPDGVKEQQALRRQLPSQTKSYIAKFTQALDRDVRDGDAFDYRVMLVPIKGPKTDAEVAMTFVRAEDLTEATRDEWERQGKVGTGVVIEKERSVMHASELRPSDVRDRVQAAVPFVVNMWHIDQVAKFHKVKPAKGEPPARTDTRYCLYVRPLQRWLYTEAFVNLCIEETSTRDRYKRLFGKEPIARVTTLSDKVGATMPSSVPESTTA